MLIYFRLVDNDLRYAWSDCELYFLKSVSQTVALKVASQTPKLGQQEMDRIKGFINDLKVMTTFCIYHFNVYSSISLQYSIFRMLHGILKKY